MAKASAYLIAAVLVCGLSGASQARVQYHTCDGERFADGLALSGVSDLPVQDGILEYAALPRGTAIGGGTYLVEACKSGLQLRINLADDLDQSGRLDALNVVAGHVLGFVETSADVSFSQIKNSMIRAGFRAELVELAQESCPCHHVYPALRGEKAVWGIAQ